MTGGIAHQLYWTNINNYRLLDRQASNNLWQKRIFDYAIITVLMIYNVLLDLQRFI
jgi:hypothetical protein